MCISGRKIVKMNKANNENTLMSDLTLIMPLTV